MPVLVAGDERDPKMIGSFELVDGKGATVAETVVKEAKARGIGKEDGRAPVLSIWDTTASNSG